MTVVQFCGLFVVISLVYFTGLGIIYAVLEYIEDRRKGGKRK